MRLVLRHITMAMLALLLFAGSSYAQHHKPQLVVNIIVSSMRANDLTRYADNFTEGGFKRLMNEGINYTAAYYNYATTTTAAGLATFTTGAQPAVHGVVGENWWNPTDSSYTTLIGDNKSYPVPFSTGAGNYSAQRLIAPTIGDMLLGADSKSKHFSIAVDPLSAIVVNGKCGTPFWVEKNQTHWTSASAFIESLPQWISDYNRHDTNSYYALSKWTTLYDTKLYHNSQVCIVEGIKGKTTQLITDVNLKLANSDIGKMCYTPAGNTMLLKFASSLITMEDLAGDTSTDILNIVLDTPRYIATTYGPESIEYEDMLYRLDRDIAEFLTYIYAQVDNPSKIVVIVSSDHGTSPSYNNTDNKEHNRINSRQMEVITNAFLGAKYGSDNYIVGYANKALYLNHQAIIAKKLSVDDIREEVATFVHQLRGVAIARSATALRNASFNQGRAGLIQQSYYPIRSGDVVMDFMPGWIIENSDMRSSSEGGYNYDRHVPLLIYGGAIKGQTVHRTIDMTTVAPTICHIVGIEVPWASTNEILTEIQR
ncbi:MAG: alkaline phosphatase family protein [Alistipes sp.]|nr:alkaline phosphatase family protein [Alistipes sp.]